MDPLKENVMELAERFVRVPSFVLAYGAFAKFYENAETLDNFKPDVLSKLLDLCLTFYNSKKNSSNLLNRWDIGRQSVQEILTCVFCKGILKQPITLYCGHTFCRNCVDNNFVCHRCSYSKKVEINECIILAKIIERLFPSIISVNKRLTLAAKLLHQGEYEESTEIYEQLLREYPDCYICMLANAEACLVTCNPEKAIEIIDKALQVQTNWPKLYCMKGIALSRINRSREAIEYLFCSLTMYPYCERLRIEIKQIFDDVFSQDDIEKLKQIIVQCSERPYSIGSVLQTLPEDLKKLVPINVWMDYSSISTNHLEMRDFVSNVDTGNSLPDQHEDNRADDVSDMYDEFLCALCLRILLLPLTPPCGHSFCRECLENCLDYKPECPLCKTSLTNYVAVSKHGVNICLVKVVKHFFADELKERRLGYESELAIMSRVGVDVQYELPVLSCCLAIPGISCPLHIYEPRYRAIVRRAITSGSRRLGVFTHGSSFCGLTDIGTLVQLKNLETLPDGRCLIDTIGCRRIRVLEGRYVEGCITIRFEFYADLPVNEKETEAYLSDCLSVHSMATDWLSRLRCETRASLVPFFGVLPNINSASPEGPEYGPPLWVWWLVSVLPLADNCKYVLLSCRNPEIRMSKLKLLLERVLSREFDSWYKLNSSGDRLSC